MLDPTREDFWQENVMVHDWPESGPNSISIEALYQAFKERYVAECLESLAADGGILKPAKRNERQA